MNQMKTMNDVYPNGYLSDGIFLDLQSYNVPWRDENINASLDVIYYSKSGDKYIGNIIKRSLVDDVLTHPKRDMIAESIFTLFQTKWEKLYKVLFEEYNPIENYRMTETETSNHTIESSGTNTGTVTNAETGTVRTDNTGNVTNANTNTVDNSVYGFNSSQAVNSDSTEGTENTTETRNLEELETRNTADTETRNLANENSETGENERSMTRSGNIGVTTSQQLLQSEIELWEWNFFNQVFADIDSVLCLSIY